jgi:hypothetical protein
MALQRTRRPRLRSGRSLCSLGSPLNAGLLAAAREVPPRRLPRRPEVAANSFLGRSHGRFSRIVPAALRWRQRPPRSMISAGSGNGAFPPSASRTARS